MLTYTSYTGTVWCSGTRQSSVALTPSAGVAFHVHGPDAVAHGPGPRRRPSPPRRPPQRQIGQSVRRAQSDRTHSPRCTKRSVDVQCKAFAQTPRAAVRPVAQVRGRADGGAMLESACRTLAACLCPSMPLSRRAPPVVAAPFAAGTALPSPLYVAAGLSRHHDMDGRVLGVVGTATVYRGVSG